MNEKIYNLEDLQETLGVGERTLLRYLSEGALTGFKIGREWRFTDEDIQLFIAKRRKATKMHPGPRVTIAEKP